MIYTEKVRRNYLFEAARLRDKAHVMFTHAMRYAFEGDRDRRDLCFLAAELLDAVADNAERNAARYAAR